MPVQLGRHVVLPGAARPVGVRDIAGGLLEIGHEPAPLEHLGQQVGHALAGQVDAAELGHRVVAVLAEHALVELVGPAGADGRRRRGLADLLQELVEEKAAQRLGRPRVPGEQRPLDHLRQVHEREDGAVEVGEVRGEGGSLLGGEGLHGAHVRGDRPT
jgi:hypothetical protein